MARMVIPVNFLDKDDYEYAMNQPNRCHYIRELVRKDRLNEQNNKDYIDKKIAELEERLRNLSETNTPKDENAEKVIKDILSMY